MLFKSGLPMKKHVDTFNSVCVITDLQSEVLRINKEATLKTN